MGFTVELVRVSNNGVNLRRCNLCKTKVAPSCPVCKGLGVLDANIITLITLDKEEYKCEESK
jgi:hypothetical protein